MGEIMTAFLGVNKETHTHTHMGHQNGTRLDRTFLVRCLHRVPISLGVKHTSPLMPSESLSTAGAFRLDKFMGRAMGSAPQRVPTLSEGSLLNRGFLKNSPGHMHWLCFIPFQRHPSLTSPKKNLTPKPHEGLWRKARLATKVCHGTMAFTKFAGGFSHQMSHHPGRFQPHSFAHRAHSRLPLEWGFTKTVPQKTRPILKTAQFGRRSSCPAECLCWAPCMRTHSCRPCLGV